MRETGRGRTLAVVPDKRSEAERRSGIHNHRERFGARWWLPVFAKANPVVMGPGLALRAPRDDGGDCG